ncbi:endogenous Bornavirus-like nucleoprotein 1 [Trachypithecus francoisi]|uniref:endogenous Bornavirus-like nucleoprotein 1 n=1 Tax=Trachypithecus francoisi TaxID=54180 RepID=UPI00141BA738|nr:endogenous Bornavirus-like nucleoprotein 1 [Trachypithecus francoisi]
MRSQARRVGGDGKATTRAVLSPEVPSLRSARTRPPYLICPRPSPSLYAFGSRLVLPVRSRGSESGHRNQSETTTSATKTIVHHGGTHGYVSAIPFTGQQSFEPRGKFGQYPSDADEPHSGIGEVEDTEQLNQCLIQHFHLIKTSLTFLCFLFHGIHDYLLTVGVSKESYLVTSFGGKNKTKMLYGQSHKGKDLRFTSLQLLSVLYCCDLLIGIGIVVGVK